jgi:hypothetical protein
MRQTLKVVLGSLVGALTIQAFFIACKDVEDAATRRDGGLIDAIADVITGHEHDARAGHDAGEVGGCCQEGVSYVTAGSRLRQAFLSGADGSKVTNYGIYDTKRDQACTSVVLSDGKYHCAPVPEIAKGLANLGDGIYFADPKCKVPLFQVPADTKQGYYPGSPSTAPGVVGPDLYDVEALLGTLPPFYEIEGTSCVRQPAVPASRTGVVWVVLGSRIKPSEFVELTPGHS